MKTKLRKIVSLLLSVVMLAGMIPAGAFADGEPSGPLGLDPNRIYGLNTVEGTKVTVEKGQTVVLTDTDDNNNTWSVVGTSDIVSLKSITLRAGTKANRSMTDDIHTVVNTLS